MSKSLSFSALLSNLLLLLLLAGAWLALAPINIGGQAAYAMVNGISMEPNYHRGDLVIARTSQEYKIGDVVVYRNAEMGGAYVIHRIIALDGDKYVFKGDNNSWIDDYEPTYAELVGKLWIYAPKLGDKILWLRQPANMALATGLLGGTLMASIYLEPGKKGKNKKKSSGGELGGLLEPVLYVLILLFVGFVALCIYAFNQPLTRLADDIKYQQSGVFSYTASAAPGIYDTNSVSTGDPIFPKLSCTMTVGFLYNMTGGSLRNISGTQSLTAKLQDGGSGWQRTIPLTPETAFNGDSFSSSAVVDLCKIQALIDSVEKQTGFSAGGYILTIAPHVSLTANASGQDLQDSFDAKLAFQFDKTHLSAVKSDVSGVDPFTSSKASQIKSTTSQFNTLPILGQTVAVFDLRAIGLAGLAISLVLLAFTAWAVLTVARQDPEAYNRLRYGGLVMDVDVHALDRLTNVIDVVNLEDLAKLAERQNTMILHVAFGNQHTYFVRSEGSAYRITSLVEPQDVGPAQPAQMRGGLR